VAQPEPIITEAAETPLLPAAATARQKRLAGLRLALLAGFLLWLSCPPITLWPLAWVAVAPLIVSVTRAARLRQAVWRGYVFGWVYLGPVWYWVGLTIVAWTHSSIGWAAWFGLTLILAGFYAAWGGVAWWLARRLTGGTRIVALAAAWVVMEWARTLGAITMPWAQLSYTQYLFPPVLQFADLTGAYGVSFLLLLVNAALAHAWQERGKPGSRLPLQATVTLAALACLYGLLRMQQPDSGRPIAVAAMQANFNSFSVPPMDVQYQIFTDLTQQAAQANPPPDLYVWAESTAPKDALHHGHTYEFMHNLARATQAGILVGSTVEDRIPPQRQRNGSFSGGDPYATLKANASVLFAPEGRPARYDKQQLVPFGEFIPLRSLLDPLVGRAFGFPEYDVESGSNAAVMRFNSPRAGEVAIGPFICYEAMYPQYARHMAQTGATLLATQSNDSWFQSRAAMEQHLASVVLRAVENRRQIVRSTTTGITCLLDAEGRITQRAPLATATYLHGNMQRLTAQTLYTRYGDWFVLCCGLFVLILGGSKIHRFHRFQR
jgi:apolipoprotein N-acyltransferase